MSDLAEAVLEFYIEGEDDLIGPAAFMRSTSAEARFHRQPSQAQCRRSPNARGEIAAAVTSKLPLRIWATRCALNFAADPVEAALYPRRGHGAADPAGRHQQRGAALVAARYRRP